MGSNVIIKKAFVDTWNWAKTDFHSYPFRFCVEIIAWAISIGCTVAMAATVPTPPLIILYPFWIVGCAMYAWASWTRNSFGMLANYLLLTLVDLVGLYRLLIN
jgi:hypothetical protein